MNTYKILFYVLLKLSINGLMATECEIPKYCEKRDMFISFNEWHQKHIICTIKRNSQLRFDIDKRNANIDPKVCNKTAIDFVKIKPGVFESNVILSAKSIDVKSLIQYISTIKSRFHLEFNFLKGFDLRLFHDSDSEINRTVNFDYLMTLSCHECSLRFYIGEKQMKSCEDFNNFSSPSSIFNFYNVFYEGTKYKFSKSFILYLRDESTDNKICPLAFKNVLISLLALIGDNSYFSQRLIKFSNETFDDLNSTIIFLAIYIRNVEVDFELIHPSIFQQTSFITFYNNVKSIYPDFFLNFKNVQNIQFRTHEFRSLIHQKGICWIKSINRDFNVNLSDELEMYEFFKNKYPVSILLVSYYTSYDKTMYEVFPEEDFCIYRDFPFNQMVILIQQIDNDINYKLWNTKVSCTFLWLIQYYSRYKFFINYYRIMIYINSEEFKSISKCNFTHRISICNKSEFHLKPIASYYDFGQSMIWTKSIVNMTSYLLCIFGFVTNLLVIITISSKKNKAEFKEFNQYKYMRINSICCLLLLSIHFLSWLTDCNYPYGIFCSKVKRTILFQYLKIIVGQFLATSLRFMINFLYIEFSFCRLALIGNNHNKLVKFMSEIGIKKYVSISLLISLILSVVKFFSYRINYGMMEHSYPIDYDDAMVRSTGVNKAFFIINFVSDLLNYVLFILIHMIMDIVMVIKLRKTLNERLEKSKEYSTKEQQEKKKTENESVLNNAISMVILNTVVGILLKIPTCVNSLIFLHFIVYTHNIFNEDLSNRSAFFTVSVCVESYFCEMFFTLADFLYLSHISIQFFFYKRFDKKFKIALKRIFATKESNTVK